MFHLGWNRKTYLQQSPKQLRCEWLAHNPSALPNVQVQTCQSKFLVFIPQEVVYLSDWSQQKQAKHHSNIIQTHYTSINSIKFSCLSAFSPSFSRPHRHHPAFKTARASSDLPSSAKRQANAERPRTSTACAAVTRLIAWKFRFHQQKLVNKMFSPAKMVISWSFH